jgi:hypothetical protein
MKSVIQVIVLLLATVPATAQEVGTVDLRQPPASSKPEEKQEKKDLREGCEKLSPGIIADGIVLTEDHQARPIVVELTRVSEKEPAEGSTMEAEVRLLNKGKQAIEIPWSLDPSVIEFGQGPSSWEWEGGTFLVSFRDHNPNGVLLVSFTEWLYGSKHSAGSMLTIRPGEWITATVKFKLEAKYLHEPGEFQGQTSELFAEWHQTRRTQSIKDCKVRKGFYRYEDFYDQEKRGVTTHVKEGASNPDGENGFEMKATQPRIVAVRWASRKESRE